MKKLSMTKGSIALRWSPQAESFSATPGESMKYLLLLNGVAGLHRDRSETTAVSTPKGCGPKWLLDSLAQSNPEVLPGEDGPIALVLVL